MKKNVKKETKKMTVPYDIDVIRKQSKQSIKEGAVTEDYPLDVKIACKLLNDALATEIMCVLRYRHHQIIAKGMDRNPIVAEFKEHAEQEEKHMLMLAERINQLGGDPDFRPETIIERSATEFGNGKSLTKMIEQDLVAERIAISVYRHLIDWFGEADPTTRRMLEKILKEEEDHANDLADFLG